MNHFFAYMARMKFITRWGLMRNTRYESVQEHSLQVAIIAHALAVIKNRFFDGKVDSERVITLSVFHEASEVITGDLATPIKYFNPEIKKAYKEIEVIAGKKLMEMLPEEIRGEYQSLLFHEADDEENWKLVKAADKISAYLKCVEEIKAGNQEFVKAERSIKRDMDELDMPEVRYFIDNFAPSFSLTIDELN